MESTYDPLNWFAEIKGCFPKQNIEEFPEVILKNLIFFSATVIVFILIPKLGKQKS